ncbi:MAG: hypothetical protein ACFWT0_04860 [Bifidobacterium crudilactis]
MMACLRPHPTVVMGSHAGHPRLCSDLRVDTKKMAMTLLEYQQPHRPCTAVLRYNPYTNVNCRVQATFADTSSSFESSSSLSESFVDSSRAGSCSGMRADAMGAAICGW